MSIVAHLMHKLLLAALLFFPLGIFCQTDGNITIKDGNIHYQTFGGGRDTLLIINGGPGMSSEGFAGLATELGKDAFCYL